MSPLNPMAPEFHGLSFLNPKASCFVPLSEATLRADAAEFHPTDSGKATLQAFEMQEEWDLRIAKREKEVEIIKSLPSYRLYCEAFPPEFRKDDDPKTPDPRDRAVSKRMWKWNVERWRLALKSRRIYSRAVTLNFREYLLQQEADGVTCEGAIEGFEVLVPGVLKSMDVKDRLRLTEPPPGLTRRSRSEVRSKGKAFG